MLNNEIYLPKGNVSSEYILGPFYHDFTDAIKHYNSGIFGKFDSNGHFFCLNNKGERYFNPILLAQYALINHDLFIKTKEKVFKEKFILHLEWFVDNAEVFKNAVTWYNKFYNSKYKLNPGWVSGMYQGQILSVLLRGFQMTNDKKYLDLSRRAFLFFSYSVAEGGIALTDKDGNLWFEEYPTTPATYVLNGFIYALLGIYDYWRIFKDDLSEEYIHKGFKTLDRNIHKYDRWYWSVYDLRDKEPLSYYYQKNIHIVLMEILYELTDNMKYKFYYNKWQRQLNSSLCYFTAKCVCKMMALKRKILQNG